MARLSTSMVVTALLLACGAEVRPKQTSVYHFDDTVLEDDLSRPDSTFLTAWPGLEDPAVDTETTIRRLTERVANGELSSEGLLRLAELLADRARDHLAEAYGVAEAAHAARLRDDDDAHERLRLERDHELRAARRDGERAIEHLRDIPDDADRRLRGKALSLEAYLLGSFDREDEALRVAHRVLQVCPACAEAADAHLRIAEQAFLEADLRVAIEHYRRVLDVPAAGTELRAYARYKCGWAYLNLARFADAWDEIDAARREASQQNEQGRVLARGATRDLVLVLTHLTVDATTALARIDDIAGDRAEREGLADRYEALLRERGRLGAANAFAAARRAATRP